jgi:AraC-like DNA-binding protein
MFRTDVLFEDHLLVWFISGETKIVQAGKTHLFQAGDTLLFPRNQLVKVINYPKDGLPHKSVAMHLTADWLIGFYKKNKIQVLQPHTPEFRTFGKHPLLQSFLASLIPYFELQETLPENIASLKREEAMSILRSIDPNIDGMLASFDPPGKIDLSGFMEKNYMFNMPLNKFGYLTGRSLTTFKRDFKKVFNTTPQKWLTQKRLELAWYELSEKKRKPGDVYLEVGFENLSHFSYVFKKHFGCAPMEAATRS